MTKNRDSFCIMPFIHLHNMSNGLMKMCCITEQPIVDDDGKTTFIGNRPIKDVWNNKFMQSIRQRMVAGEEISFCNDCYKIEDAGGKSLRTEYNNQYKEQFDSFVSQSKDNGGKIDFFPPFVELRTGNTCNSACRMCNSNDSSLVYKENKEILNSPYFNNPQSVIGDPEIIIFGSKNDRMNNREMNLDNHFDEIISNIDDIKIMTLSGGEPFLLEKTTILLEEIANKNPNIRLNINTNGSVLSDRIISALEKINEVRISVSIDGYGTVQEYIRYPLNWIKIEKNIQRLKNIPKHGSYLNFNITVQALNILNLESLLLFLTTKYPGHYVNLFFLTNPVYFSIQNLPQHIKDHAVELNNALSNKLRNITTNPGFETDNKLLLVERLLELNSYMMAETNSNPVFFEQFKTNISIYDRHRKQDIKDYIPDWVTFI